MRNNPALRETPRNEPAAVIPSKGDPSILAWLEGTGRLLERDPVVSPVGDAEEEEIDELIDNEDDNDDFDDDNLELDD